jgi:hypothetical protein
LNKTASLNKTTPKTSLNKTTSKTPLNKTTSKTSLNGIGSEIQAMPPIIELSDDEKFINSKGEIVDIIAVGKKNWDGIYFRVKCIQKGFNLPRLSEILTDKRRNGYKYGTHYVNFMVDTNTIQDTKPSKDVKLKLNENKPKIKSELFLTYKGIIRVVFTTRNGNADEFIDWSCKTLYSAQMGTTEQKNKLVGKLKRVSPDVVKSVFDKTSSTLPCIYIFSLGTVKLLRKQLNIDNNCEDTSVVYKFGMTKNLSNRTNDHKLTYSKMGADVNLEIFNFIDPLYTLKAESEINKYFKDCNLSLKHASQRELVVFSKSQFEDVKLRYNSVATKYMGHITELTEKIKDKEKQCELEKETHAKEIAEKETIIASKEMEIANKEIEIANKETMIANKETEIANKETEIANKETIIANKEKEIAINNLDAEKQISELKMEIQKIKHQSETLQRKLDTSKKYRGSVKKIS